METQVNLNPMTVALLIGFLALFFVVLRYALRQQRQLDTWLDERASEQGWLLPEDARDLAAQNWYWFGGLHGRRGVDIERLAVNPRRNLVEAEFILVRRLGGRSGRTRKRSGRLVSGQQALFGIVARLPRSFVPALLVLPQTGPLRILEWAMAIDLPAISVDDRRATEHWRVLSDDPSNAQRLVQGDETLRGALVDIARTDLGRDWPEEVQGRGPRVHIGRRPKYQILILEFRGDKVTLLGGPRFVGRNPFADLGETARLLSERLKSRRVAD